MRSLQQILAARARWPGPSVLGTVVDVRGSAYRMPGARMLMRDDGARLGMISGGCLEKDVVRHAFAWTADGPSVVEYDTRTDELHPAGRYGTGCDGIVHLLLERVTREVPDVGVDPLGEIGRVWESRTAATMATVYDGPPELIGKRVVRCRDGLRHDALEEATVAALDRALSTAGSGRRPVSVQTAGVTALVEPLRPPLDVVVIGAGDDAQPLVAMGAQMGWRVRVADKWPALVTRERFPTAHALVCAAPDRVVDELVVSSDAVVVLLTHNLGDDAALLPGLLACGADVLLVGPRRRTARLLETLAGRGQLPSAAQLDQLQTPAGLDLGGEAPEEVAVSIVAGIVARMNGREGGTLAHNGAAIHDEHVRMVIE